MIRKRPNDRSVFRHQNSSLWSKCSNLRSLKQIHASLVVNGFNSDRSALRELVFASAMVISGTIEYAHKVFAKISDPDTFMFNTMIRGSAQSPHPIKAVSVYTQMEKRGVKADCFTFPFVLKACTRLCWLKMGFVIQGKAVKYGFWGNTFLRNTLIYFHANCGDLEVAMELFDDLAKREVVAWSALTAGYARRGELRKARQLFDDMPTKDLVSWNVMITAYTKRGEMERARELFDRVPRRDVVTWNAMIAGYVLCGSCRNALEMFEEMKGAGEQPDEVTMLSLLSVCADLGDLDVGKNVHHSLSKMVDMEENVLIGNAVIDMYSKCGSIEGALHLFRGMRQKDVTTWNSIIGGLALHGYAEEAIDLFHEMQRAKVEPNEITFVGVLIACSHCGRVKEGRGYFQLMKEGYQMKPNIKHYGCMVDMLGRAGLLDEAFEFIHLMPIQPNAIIWRTLLGACRLYGNVDLARNANVELLKLQRDHSGDYVLLSNVYALTGEWDEVEKVRQLMDDTGVKKKVGHSVVEAEDKTLMQFLLGTKPKLHLRTQESYRST